MAVAHTLSDPHPVTTRYDRERLVIDLVTARSMTTPKTRSTWLRYYRTMTKRRHYPRLIRMPASLRGLNGVEFAPLLEPHLLIGHGFTYAHLYGRVPMKLDTGIVIVTGIDLSHGRVEVAHARTRWAFSRGRLSQATLTLGDTLPGDSQWSMARLPTSWTARSTYGDPVVIRHRTSPHVNKDR